MICASVQTNCEPRELTAQPLLTEDTFKTNKYIFIDRMQVDTLANEKLTYATISWAYPGCQCPNKQRPRLQLDVTSYAIDRNGTLGGAFQMPGIFAVPRKIGRVSEKACPCICYSERVKSSFMPHAWRPSPLFDTPLRQELLRTH